MCFFENPILLFKALQLVNETLVGVGCDDGLLNFDVLFVLLVFGFAPGLLLLAIDVQHLVRNGKVRVNDL